MKVFIVLRNADVTEGRGPMVIDTAFTNFDHALTYIDRQPGVMGTCPAEGRKEYYYRTGNFGDFEIKEIEAHENTVDLESIRRQQAYTAATEKIRRVMKRDAAGATLDRRELAALEYFGLPSMEDK